MADKKLESSSEFNFHFKSERYLKETGTPSIDIRNPAGNLPGRKASMPSRGLCERMVVRRFSPSNDTDTLLVRVSLQEIFHVGIGLFQGDAPLDAADESVLNDCIVCFDGEFSEGFDVFGRKLRVVPKTL